MAQSLLGRGAGVRVQGEEPREEIQKERLLCADAGGERGALRVEEGEARAPVPASASSAVAAAAAAGGATAVGGCSAAAAPRLGAANLVCLRQRLAFIDDAAVFVLVYVCG